MMGWYALNLYDQMNRAIPQHVFDTVHTDPAAQVLVDAAETLIEAGLSLAPRSDAAAPLEDDGPFTPLGVGLELVEHAGGRAVRVVWGLSDDADYRTVGVMLVAVAEVLRVHGYEVQAQPGTMTYVITGREK